MKSNRLQKEWHYKVIRRGGYYQNDEMDQWEENKQYATTTRGRSEYSNLQNSKQYKRKF